MFNYSKLQSKRNFEMQVANQSLKTAYERCHLADHGISFERATTEPMYSKCLARVAHNLETIKQPPLPRHPCKPHYTDDKD
jgi:hypothetical protein